MSILLDPAPPITGDVLRIVTLSDGGRPIEVLNLNDGTGYFRQRDQDFTFTPAASSVQYSNTARRYGGARAVGQTHQNGTIAWTCYVKGSSDSDIRTRVENLLAQIAEVGRGRYVEWAPGSGQSSFFELAGPGDWQPAYQVRQFIEGFAVSVQLTFPVLPLVRWAPMTITDDLSPDSITDYTFDALTSASLTYASTSYTPNGSLTSERRVRHTARGYQLAGGQAVITGNLPAATTNYKLGVTLRASSTSYIEAYVDDNGTNSRLRIDVILSGVRTNRASVNLGARISGNHRVGGRIEGNTVYADHWNASGGFNAFIHAAPTTSTSYTLTTGELLYTAGNAGWTWTPQASGAQLLEWGYTPFYWRNAVAPAHLSSLVDAIPGNVPALADVGITTSGGTSAPVWACLGYARGDVSGAAFGIFEAESAFLTGWASSAQAGARGGFDVRATAAGAATYNANFVVDTSFLDSDDFAETLDVEIYARALITSTLVNPTLIASLLPWTNSSSGQQFTPEFGSAGRVLVKPSAGTVYRPVRLGTLTVPVTTASAAAVVNIDGAVSVGSTGVFGIDYFWVVPSRSRALGPTGKPLDSNYPKLVPSTALWTKVIRSDLSGALEDADLDSPFRDHGLSGSLLQLQPGVPVGLLVKLSSLVPDDPTSNTTTEQLSHTATVRVDVTPRSFLLRSS